MLGKVPSGDTEQIGAGLYETVYQGMSFTHSLGWICHLHTCVIIFRYFQTYGFYSKKLFDVNNSIASLMLSLPKSAGSYCKRNKKEELKKRLQNCSKMLLKYMRSQILPLNCNNRYNQLSRNGKQCIRHELLVSLITQLWLTIFLSIL